MCACAGGLMLRKQITNRVKGDKKTKGFRDFKQDLTLANAVGWAPVHVAAMQGRIKTNGSLFEGELVILRDAGVDLNAKTKDGWTPAFLAAMN